MPFWEEIKDALSNVEKFRYWQDVQVVQVRYHRSSAIFNYFPVNAEMYNQILQAESKAAIIDRMLTKNKELQRWKYYYQ
jgi:hypothetical protein